MSRGKPFGPVVCAAAIVALVAVTSASSRADTTYPNRAIKFVVPLAAGGAADLVPRIVADRLAARWGHPVVVENRPGAGHTIGAESVYKSEPDGYVLFASPPGPFVTSQLIYPRLGYDPAGFVPVTIMTTGRIVLIANPKLPAANLRELIAYAKANPGKLRYASPGVGSTPHMTGEMFKALAGIETTHVPYRGLSLAITDILAGHVDVMFDNLGNSLPHIRSGKLRVLGVADASRIPQLPDTPAIAETFPGFLSTSWYTLVAPPRTPPAIAAKLSDAVREILREPDVVKRLAELSFLPVGSTPSEAGAFINREAVRWREAVGTALSNSRSQ